MKRILITSVDARFRTRREEEEEPVGTNRGARKRCARARSLARSVQRATARKREKRRRSGVRARDLYTYIL